MYSMYMKEIINTTKNELLEKAKQMEKVSSDFKELDKPINVYTDGIKPNNLKNKFERYSNNLIPRNGGEWTGEPGNSDWVPDPDAEPGNRNGTNPEHKKWKEIEKEYGFERIPFKDGEPDFSEVSKGTVEIDDFSDDRDSNFAQADEKLAEQKGCTPEEVEKWRKEHKYTWHECKDCKTMQKVPSEVHGNISHSGGISEAKSKKQDE